MNLPFFVLWDNTIKYLKIKPIFSSPVKFVLTAHRRCSPKAEGGRPPPGAPGHGRENETKWQRSISSMF